MASKSYMHGRGEVLPPFHAQMFAYQEYNLHKMKSSQRIFNWKFYFRSIFSLGIEKLNHTVWSGHYTWTGNRNTSKIIIFGTGLCQPTAHSTNHSNAYSSSIASPSFYLYFFTWTSAEYATRTRNAIRGLKTSANTHMTVDMISCCLSISFTHILFHAILCVFLCCCSSDTFWCCYE